MQRITHFILFYVKDYKFYIVLCEGLHISILIYVKDYTFYIVLCKGLHILYCFSAEWKEYHVNHHNHTSIDSTTMSYLVAEDEGDAITAQIKNCLPDKDPLNQVGAVELKIQTVDSDVSEIVGIDLNGDIIARKG